MIEKLSVVAAFLGIASIMSGLLGILFTITVAFQRIRIIVEAQIAEPGAYLDMTKALRGDGPLSHSVLLLHAQRYLQCLQFSWSLLSEQWPIVNTPASVALLIYEVRSGE